MKKFVAILLTLMLVLGVSAAFAEDYRAVPTVTVTKVYKLVNAGSSPKETFTLEQIGKVVKDGEATEVPDLGAITGAKFAAGGATATGTEKNITITLPTYDKVGVYEYTLKEVAGTTAGVAYYGDSIKLVVTVLNGADGKVRVAGVHTEKGESSEKSDKFENTYSAGTLKVTKIVTGNLGDKTKFFEFKVTLTGVEGKTYADSYAVTVGSHGQNPATIKIGEETTFYLKDGDTISIANLPYGVTYAVTEIAVEGYTTTKTGDTGIIGLAEQIASFKNEKNGEIDTGVTTESLPYVLLMGFVALAGAALLLKRRARNN